MNKLNSCVSTPYLIIYHTNVTFVAREYDSFSILFSMRKRKVDCSLKCIQKRERGDSILVISILMDGIIHINLPTLAAANGLMLLY